MTAIDLNTFAVVGGAAIHLFNYNLYAQEIKSFTSLTTGSVTTQSDASITFISKVVTTGPTATTIKLGVADVGNLGIRFYQYVVETDTWTELTAQALVLNVSLPAAGSYSLIALTSTRIVVATFVANGSGLNVLRAFDFNGVDWDENVFSFALPNNALQAPDMTAFSSTEFSYIDNLGDILDYTLVSSTWAEVHSTSGVATQSTFHKLASHGPKIMSLWTAAGQGEGVRMLKREASGDWVQSGQLFDNDSTAWNVNGAIVAMTETDIIYVQSVAELTAARWTYALWEGPYGIDES